MKCPHCQKEINESGFAYCPHCGKQLSERKGVSLRKGGLLALILWVGLNCIISGIFSILWGFDAVSVLSFAVIFALAVLYAFGVWAIYTVAKRNMRNAVRWTTAAIVFSPALAWIVYGLSWSKSQQ
jgi:hypothetical protein